MNCHAHLDVSATRSCHACSKPLCTECSHEVIGTFYCAACLHERLVGQSARGRRPGHIKSPFLAGLFSVVMPGLGQVYNGLMARALAVFLGQLGLLFVVVTVMDRVRGASPLEFLPLLLPIYFIWQIVDAVGTARDINRLGHVPDAEEAKAIGRGSIPGLEGGGKPLGMVLIGCGGLAFLANLGFTNMIGQVLEYGWPVAIILAGLWLVRRGRKERRVVGDYDALAEFQAEIDAYAKEGVEHESLDEPSDDNTEAVR